MNEHASEVVIARSRVKYNEGYMPGFGNDFETEALEGALPIGQNSPQRCPYGLYAEQLSGSPFTAPRAANERSWLYRMRPTVRHIGEMSPLDLPLFRSAPTVGESRLPLAPMRWDPAPIPDEPTTFLSGMRTISTGGDVHTQTGFAINSAMINVPIVSSSVTGRRTLICSITGVRSASDRPRSPRSTLPSQVRYCTTSGRSRPSSCRRPAIASGVASCPRMTLAGSPGIR